MNNKLSNDRFSEDEFKLVDSETSYNAYHCHIGKYLIRLWGGSSAKSTPKRIMPSVSDYTTFEVEIFSTDKSQNPSICQDGINYYSISPDKFGISWGSVDWSNLSRGLYSSIATIRSIMNEMYKEETNSKNISSKRLEAPCNTCRRNNDIGVTECWWCGCSNPVL